MTKKANQEEKHWYRASLLTGTPAKFLGYVMATDDRAAEEEAAREYKISAVLPNRIVVRRDD